MLKACYQSSPWLSGKVDVHYKEQLSLTYGDGAGLLSQVVGKDAIWTWQLHPHNTLSSLSSGSNVNARKGQKDYFWKCIFLSLHFFQNPSLPLLVWTAQMEVLENVDVITTTSAWHLFLNVVVRCALARLPVDIPLAPLDFIFHCNSEQ